jgi:hypothetical protein
MKFKPLLVVIGLALLLSSCKTYFIPVDSFRRQFAGLDSSGSRLVVTKDPFGGKTVYKTYPIDSILCVDKNGVNMVLKVSPSIEVRFTDKQDKKTVFYFDLMVVRNDTVTGGRSRFIPSLKRSIPLSNVKTIEVQDGGKKYSYSK